MAQPREHQPVLLPAVVATALPALRGEGAVVVDGTVGFAGHAAPLLAAAPGARLVGFDRDPLAVAAAGAALAAFGPRARVRHGSYADLETLEPEVVGRVDVLLVDLGVSSPQLDRAERGFGFRQRGPLDMRFDPTAGETAAGALDRLGTEELAEVLREYGDVPQPRRVARALQAARDAGRLETTTDLAAAVERVLGRPRGGRIAAATLVFQALRIFVNDEPGHLRRLLAAAPRWLSAGGRLLAVSFHSGEDRLVKQAIRFWERGPELPPGLPAPPWAPVLRALARKPTEPDAAEAAANPRARSAKLRVAERTAAPVPAGADPWRGA